MNSDEPQAPASREVAPVPSSASITGRKSRLRRRWGWTLLVGVAGATVFLLFLRFSQGQSNSGKTAGAPAKRAVPVVAQTAKKGDIGVYLTGLGTVTALKTVTVRSRVDGQLVRVAFREGQLVHEGELIAEIDPRPFEVQLTQAEGQNAKDQAALANARIDLQRYQVLFDQDSVPKQQLDTQVATVHQYEASLESDRGQVESAKLNLTYCRITAPISGRVGLRLVDPGNMVHVGDPGGLVVITEVQPIAVIFTLSADQLPRVLKQMHPGRDLQVEAYDRDLKNKLASGTILAIDNQIDPTTGTVRIKALFPNEDDALFPNQFVNARLLLDTLHDAVIVPTAAIQRSPQSTFVYAVKPDETVEMREVEVQLTEGNDTAVGGGVAAGDTIVVDGIDKLQPGTLVSVGQGDSEGHRKRNP